MISGYVNRWCAAWKSDQMQRWHEYDGQEMTTKPWTRTWTWTWQIHRIYMTFPLFTQNSLEWYGYGDSCLKCSTDPNWRMFSRRLTTFINLFQNSFFQFPKECQREECDTHLPQFQVNLNIFRVSGWKINYILLELDLWRLKPAFLWIKISFYDDDGL